MMKAAVIYEAGGPEVLKLEERSVAKPQIGQVLIQVKAFRLNRSEMFTRQGHSPNVKFPRILGIEVVGLVEEATGNGFRKGGVVVTAMDARSMVATPNTPVSLQHKLRSLRPKLLAKL